MKRLTLTLVLLLATASASLAQQNLPVLSGNAPVGPRDAVQVKVLEEPNVDTARAVIADDGTITLNLLGKVEVAGLSAAEIETRIKNLLEAGLVRKATVSVQVVEYGNRPISVVGAVTRPGRLGATSNVTLIQAITQAGGLAGGYGPELYILRTADNGLTERLTVNLNELLVNANPDVNVPLAPNDVVNVPVETPIQIYMLGEVTQPGPVSFRRAQTPTLLQSLAAAGGATDRAGKQVTITRRVDGQESIIKVRWRDIASGKKKDVTLVDNDTIFFPESIF
jgi:polysaccharide export outer membrane protein